MNYIPQLRAELVKAAARQTVDDAPPHRLVPRASRPIGLLAVKLAVAGIVSATALAATGVLPLGSAITSLLSPSANSAQGTAVANTVQLLPVRASDPAGGAPWGLQVAHTTRGFVCTEVGRVEDGTVGVIGQDGAAANDGRFHPYSTSATQRLGCTLPDADGHGFVNVALADVPASGLVGEEEHSCLPGQAAAGRAECASSDLREVYYGLLGPDAVSLTYRGQSGASQSLTLQPPDGAYLIVLPQLAGFDQAGNRAGPGIFESVIESVTYKDGHTCEPEPEPLREGCLPVGFARRSAQPASQAPLTTSVAAHVVQASQYCATGGVIEVCSGPPPAGAQPLTSAPGGSSLVRVTFASPRAIPDGHAYYSATMQLTPSKSCSDQGSNAATDTDIERGATVTMTMLVPNSCAGSAKGEVTYVERDGPAGPAPVSGLPGQTRGQSVGTFTLTVP